MVRFQEVLLLVVVCAVGGTAGQDSFLELPNPQLCLVRPWHASLGSNKYYFSWRGDQEVSETYLDWLDARNWCRRRCMDLVSFDIPGEYLNVKLLMLQDGINYIWTSGRRCDFSETCNRQDLQPVDIFGWFWSGSNTKMKPTNQHGPENDWSSTGGSGVPQPDNREGTLGGYNESCLAVLNDFYDDGVRWHDVACHHLKHWICEDSTELLAYASRTNPHLHL